MQEGLEVAVLLLSPIVPHCTRELWHVLGHTGDVVDASWPVADSAALVQDEISYVLQVNGKKRSQLQAAVNTSTEDLEKQALADETVQRHLEGKTLVKVVVVPGRLINIVVR